MSEIALIIEPPIHWIVYLYFNFFIFNPISDYHEDLLQKSAASSEILENFLIKSESMNQYDICIQDCENLQNLLKGIPNSA